MSQSTIWNVPLAGPGTMGQFAGRAGPALDALLTMHSGADRPPYAVANQLWLKIVSGSVWELYAFDGTDDILIGTINTGANSFTVNSTALGFATSLVARTDVSPLSLVNGRVVLTQEGSGQGQIELKGINSGNGDQGAIRWTNGVSAAQVFKLLSQASTNSLRLLNSSDTEIFRFGADGDIVSALFGKLSEQITPVGTIIFGPWTSAPAGFLTISGALLSRVTYARLWALAQASGKLVSDATWLAGAYGAFSTGDGSTTFRIPRSTYFPRLVYDESSYTIGTYRADTNKSHDHGGNTGLIDLSHTHFYNVTGSANLNVQSGFGAFANYLYSLTSTGSPSVSMNHQHSIASNGASEGEPQNLPMLGCIKY